MFDLMQYALVFYDLQLILARMAPEGEDHVKVQASLDCKRNIICSKTYGSAIHTILQILAGSQMCQGIWTLRGCSTS